MKYSLLHTAFVFALSVLSLSLSAQHYWVGGSGNWTDPSHWATTSGGNTFHAAPPTQDDDVFFDENSFASGGQTVTMDDDDANCRTMDWSGAVNNPAFIFPGSEALNVFGSLILSPDMTCDVRIIEMESTGEVMISTAGVDLGSSSILRLNASGTYNLSSRIDVRELQVQEGVLNTNGNTINCDFAVRISGTGAKTINLGSSVLNLEQWRTSGTNITLNASNATINCQSFFGDVSGSGPYEYGTVVIGRGGSVNNTSSFSSLSIINNEINDLVRIQSGITLTCGQFSALGTRYAPIELVTGDEGQHATIVQTTGTAIAEYVSMKDIHGTGGADFIANNATDRGNNDGWTFDPVEILDFYWIGGNGVWTDPTHWARASGSTDTYDRFPSQFDNAVFDENSFDGPNQTVILDTPAQVNNMDWEGVVFNPRLAREEFTDDLSVYGSINLTDSVNLGIASIRFNGIGEDKTIHLGNDNGLSNVSFWGEGDWTLLSDIDCGSFNVGRGHLNTNDRSIDVNFTFSFGNSGTASMDMSGSEITARDFLVRERMSELVSGNSRITVRRNFEGRGNEFNEVILEDNAVVEDANTFSVLTVSPGTSVAFEADSSQVILEALQLNGTPDSPINLSSTSAGRQATLSLANGIVDGTYLVLQDMNATGGATFNAVQSIDNGNNTGWNISEIEPLDFYWVGGSGNWSDAANHWARSSGGNDFYSFVPGPLDNVFFDENSFSADGEEVTLDIDAINFHDMDWSGVSVEPILRGVNTDINIYGSIGLHNLADLDVRNLNFLSNETETIDFGNPSYPGTRAVMSFDGEGTWNFEDSLTTREIQFFSGTINTNSHGVHVDFETIFFGAARKQLNLGTSNYYSRSFNWGGDSGDNLGIDGDESKIFCSSAFLVNSPFGVQPDDITLNELTFVASADNARTFGDIELNRLVIEPGKDVTLSSSHTIFVNDFVAQGNAEAFISISGQFEGSQATISQASGTVDGQFLELKDIAATGGATFNANNSINNGNVSGWNFFGQPQSIDFPEIDDRLESAEAFAISASASSGLPVTFEVVGGAATVEGDIVTLNGAGEVQIRASQAGNIEFNPAPSVVRSFCAIPMKPTITADDTNPNLLTSSREEGNQWFVDGVEIDGATGQSHLATIDGLYTVQITLGPCISEISDGVDVRTTSVVDLLKVGGVSVFPNPVISDLTIQFGSVVQGLLEVTLIDAGGMIRKNQRVNADINDVVHIDVSDLPPGIYYLTGTSDNGVFRIPVVKI